MSLPCRLDTTAAAPSGRPIPRTRSCPAKWSVPPGSTVWVERSSDAPLVATRATFLPLQKTLVAPAWLGTIVVLTRRRPLPAVTTRGFAPCSPASHRQWARASSLTASLVPALLGSFAHWGGTLTEVASPWTAPLGILGPVWASPRWPAQGSVGTACCALQGAPPPPAHHARVATTASLA